MANPDGQVPVNPDAVRAAEERFLLMEAEMRTLREQNEALMRELREQQSVAEAERLRAGRRTQAQVDDFAQSDGRAAGATCRSCRKLWRTANGRQDGAAGSV